jgi:phage shock protein PspC (stress-responsive transcriptional regulator)
MPLALRRLLWFAAIWFASIAALSVVAYAIRWAIMP